MDETKLYAQQLDAIIYQAQALRDKTVAGPRYAAVRRLLSNVETLRDWTADDRSRI